MCLVYTKQYIKMWFVFTKLLTNVSSPNLQGIFLLGDLATCNVHQLKISHTPSTSFITWSEGSRLHGVLAPSKCTNQLTAWLLGPGNTKGVSIAVLLTSCLTSLNQSVLKIKTKIVSCYTANSKPVKQEVYGKVILPPLEFPAWSL